MRRKETNNMKMEGESERYKERERRKRDAYKRECEREGKYGKHEKDMSAKRLEIQRRYLKSYIILTRFYSPTVLRIKVSKQHGDLVLPIAGMRLCLSIFSP